MFTPTTNQITFNAFIEEFCSSECSGLICWLGGDELQKTHRAFNRVLTQKV